MVVTLALQACTALRTEECTRREHIGPQLGRAKWYVRDGSKVNLEIAADGKGLDALFSAMAIRSMAIVPSP